MTDARIPERQRWATAWTHADAAIAGGRAPLLRRDAPFALMGGRLAAALARPLTEAGFTMVAAERRHPLFADVPAEADEYEAFGNGYGEIASARAFRQLVGRAARTFSPAEDRWPEPGRIVDPFRPNLRYAAACDREFEVLGERHLNAVRTAFRRAGVLLVALSSGEIWEAKADGAVFPHWASAGERRFDPERHQVRMLTLEETIADLGAAIADLRELNPELEIVLMVSPEPQAATALPRHVLAVSALGQAVLRIAAETAARAAGVRYFPALEIAALRAPLSAWSGDGSVPDPLTAAIVSALTAASEGGDARLDEDSELISVTGQSAPLPAAPTPELVEASPGETPAKAAPAATRRKRTADAAPASKPKPVQPTAIDPYSIAKAAADAEKKASRSRKRASQLAVKSEAADSSDDKRARKKSERAAKREKRAAVREEKAAVREGKAAVREEEATARSAQRPAGSAAPEGEEVQAPAPTPRARRGKRSSGPSQAAPPPISAEGPAQPQEGGSPQRRTKRAKRTEKNPPSSDSASVDAAAPRRKRTRKAKG